MCQCIHPTMGCMPKPDDRGAITVLLKRMISGDAAAGDELMPHVYEELRRLAAHYLHNERPDHTLQATALVHEAYLRLVSTRDTDIENRAHFFAVAARIMRQVLVDHAREHCAAKRGGAAKRVEFEEGLIFSEDQYEFVLDVNRALDRLAERDEQEARIVEMRFFGGLTEEEVALVLGVSSRTVRRDWNHAKAWLAAEMASA